MQKNRAASTRKAAEAGLRLAEANHPLHEIPCGVDQEAHGGRPPSGGGRRPLAKKYHAASIKRPTEAGLRQAEADDPLQKIPRGVDQEADGGWPPTGGGQSSLAKNTMRRRSKGRRGPASDKRRPKIPCNKYRAASTKRPTEAGLRQAEANHPCQKIPCGRDGGQRRLGTL